MSLQKQEQLKRSQYHWFWGLRTLTTPQNPSLLDNINLWSQGYVNKVREKQVGIKRRFILMRCIYWIFNLSNYAEDYYKIKAYDWLYDTSSEEFKMGRLSMFKNKCTEWINKRWTFNKKNDAAPNSYDNELDDIPSSRGTENSASSKNNSFANMESIEAPKEVLVNSWMMPYLKTLEIYAEIGQIIALADIKKSYYQKAILFHPDKNKSPDAKETFTLILSAYKKLSAAFDSSSVSEDLTTFASSWEDINQLKHDFDEHLRFWKELKLESKKNIAEYQKWSRKLTEDEKILTENQKQLDVLNQKVDELLKQQQERRIQSQEQHDVTHMALIPSNRQPSPQLDTPLLRQSLFTQQLFKSGIIHLQTIATQNRGYPLMICDKPSPASLSTIE